MGRQGSHFLSLTSTKIVLILSLLFTDVYVQFCKLNEPTLWKSLGSIAKETCTLGVLTLLHKGPEFKIKAD